MSLTVLYLLEDGLQLVEAIGGVGRG